MSDLAPTTEQKLRTMNRTLITMKQQIDQLFMTLHNTALELGVELPKYGIDVWITDKNDDSDSLALKVIYPNSKVGFKLLESKVDKTITEATLRRLEEGSYTVDVGVELTKCRELFVYFKRT